MQISEERQTFSPVCQGKSQAYFSILARALKICNAKLYSYYIYRPQRSCEGYVFRHICDSVHGGGGGCAIPACIAGGIPACLAAGGCLLKGGSAPRGCLLWGVPAWGVACSGGCLLRGACWGGGVETPESRWLLLRTVRILLECILVIKELLRLNNIYIIFSRIKRTCDFRFLIRFTCSLFLHVSNLIQTTISKFIIKKQNG